MHAAIENARRAGVMEGSGTGISSLQVPTASVLPPIVQPEPLPAPVVPTSTTVSTNNVQLEGRLLWKYHDPPLTRIDHRTPALVIHFFSAIGDFPIIEEFPRARKVDLSRFATALSSFQVYDSSWFVVSASLSTPEQTGFSVTITDSYPSGSTCGLGGTSGYVIELDECAVDMQCGMWSVPEAARLRQSKKFINFPMRYDMIPQVLVWLAAVQMSCLADSSIELQVEDLCSYGFTLKVISKALGFISADISWLACPVQRLGVSIGTFCAENTVGDDLGRSCDGYVGFPRGWFKVPPRVAVGIRSVELDQRYSASLSIEVVQVTSEGMKWRMSARPGAGYKSATASFIAVE